MNKKRQHQDTDKTEDAAADEDTTEDETAAEDTGTEGCKGC
jgi:hypothetical protein